MTFASDQRASLARLLHDLGPDAQTLCEGWTTRDLAVHLVLRETRPDAAVGMFVPLLSGHLDKVSARLAAQDYDAVVDRWAAGPSGLFQVLDKALNTVEHFVHHEDVRRAQPGMKAQPLPLTVAQQRQLWAAAKMIIPRLLSTSQAPVVVVPDGLSRVVAADKAGVSTNGANVAHVAGPVGEIVLWAYGRDVATVKVSDEYGVIRRSSI
ncbi:TIGR03085 family metal-binding protein [Corynebacterium aquilae]|nr:TIGR03085 family metal-binding protein [Corynebacterium aquilae]